MRSAGVLLHISSLPGKGGVGSLGREARQFVDFLKASGQSWWQVLPLTAPARGNSPYSSYSVFAGNPAFISLEMLKEEGVLSFWTQKFTPKHSGEKANYDFCNRVQLPLLYRAYKLGAMKKCTGIEEFKRKNEFWLGDYALFMALKNQYGYQDFHDWPQPLALRDPHEMQKVQQDLASEIEFWVWIQYLFFRQWDALKAYANQNGIGIIGDMPMYADADSADVWAKSGVFQLDHKRCATALAGVPPDFFSTDGQLWGNPLYDWDFLASTGFEWWTKRLRHAASMYDQVRIDHFRALDAYYAVPAGEKTARNGRWCKGPGMAFIETMRKEAPDCRIIAEDLGESTESLKELLKISGLPGMKVLQFAFDPQGDSEFLPHNYEKNCVAYTGTHDNDTIRGWFKTAAREQALFARKYLRLSAREGYHWGFIRGVYASAADMAIIPMQDFLGLSSGARMNTPGVAQGNWGWRVNGRLLTPQLAAEIYDAARLYRRLPNKKINEK